MDITKENFNEKFDELKEVIDRATFISIDGEFTGVDTNDEDISRYDTLADFYTKTCSTAKDYIMIQFGLTAFRLVNPSEENPDQTAFTYRSYNFYIYPKARHKRFMCQGSSLEFLAENKFDFNKLFQHGLSYCNRKEEIELLDRFAEKEKWLNESNGQVDGSDSLVEVPDDEKEKLERIRDIIEKFLVSADKERVIDNMNAFQRKLVYQLIETVFADRVSANTKLIVNNRKAIVIKRKRTQEEEKEYLSEKLEQEKSTLNDAIGFRRFIDVLSKSKKLIVGHNMLLDVMFIMEQFFDPLPKSLKTFKHVTHKVFPNILDTKYLCQAEEIKTNITSTVLSNLYRTIVDGDFNLPKIECESNEYAYSSDNPKEHEAGYDSYITGLCFIALGAKISIEPDDLNENSKALQSYINKLFVFRLANNSFIHLTGKEPEPNRGHIFHIKTPPDWVLSSIMHHFRNYGPVFVSWTGPNEAYVDLKNREHSSILIESISKPDGFSIQTYADYQLTKTGNSTDDECRKLKRKIETDTTSSDGPSHQKKPKHEWTAETKKTPVAENFKVDDDWSV